MATVLYTGPGSAGGRPFTHGAAPPAKAAPVKLPRAGIATRAVKMTPVEANPDAFNWLPKLEDTSPHT